MPLSRPRATYANVASTLALVVATSGTAYAAGTITSRDLQNDSVKSIDLKDDVGVRGKDVAADTLTGKQIDESTLGLVPEANFSESSALTDFAAESAWADIAGEAGVAGHQLVYGGNQTLAPISTDTYSADCPTGKVAVSGGFWTASSDVDVFYAYVTDPNTYTVAFWNSSGSTRSVGVHVVCVEG